MAVLAAAALVACCGDATPAAPTTALIRTLLRAQGAAVLHRHRATFASGLADVDGAGAYRGAQLAAFDNLTKLSFSTWNYSLGARTDDRSVERSATDRYGRPAVVYRVTLRYQLSGYDRTPTSRTLYWTFVRVDGHAAVAGDSALAATGGNSWRGPWDFGPLVVGRSASALVLAHASAGSPTSLVQQIDAAVPAVTRVWGTGWPRKVVALVPATDAEFDADTTSAPDASRQVAAVTVADGTDPLTGFAYGVRLVVNPAVLTTLSTVGRQITLRHEITHIAASGVTTDVTPQWLVEGFADYVGQLGSGQPVATAAAELAASIRAGRVPTSLPDDATFENSGTAAQAYEAGWLACRLIAADAGAAGLVRFYRLVSAGVDVQTAVGDGLRSVLGIDEAAFTARWQSYLRTELG